MTEHAASIVRPSALVAQSLALAAQIQQYVQSGHEDWREALESARVTVDLIARVVGRESQ